MGNFFMRPVDSVPIQRGSIGSMGAAVWQGGWAEGRALSSGYRRKGRKGRRKEIEYRWCLHMAEDGAEVTGDN